MDDDENSKRDLRSWYEWLLDGVVEMLSLF
jgi:hypothetical protein